jgi:fumarate hydratase subunit alpha
MKEISSRLISDTVRELLIEANYVIGPDVEARMRMCLLEEPSPEGRDVMEQLLQNYEIARTERVAICQDTGMAVVFLDVGQDVHIEGDLNEAVADGVRRAYREGYLRKSVVRDPLYDRTNTGDNTPPVVHVRIVPGDKVDILVSPKGFGSENMSQIRMLVPADGEEGLVRFVTEAIEKAGPNPCPPVIVGVGIGGTMEMAAILAKRMTARSIDQPNPDPRYAALEARILSEINKSGVGPAGIGGRTTALAVNIATYPTHIASMPVAVNVCCHAARHAHRTI